MENTAAYNRNQALGMIGHILSSIALNRSFERTVEELAEWQIQLLEQHGYYSELNHDPHYGLTQFVNDFTRGRRLIYEEVETRLQDNTAIIRTDLWFYEDPPEVFFYFDVSLEEFSQFVCALAQAHARACGFCSRIEHRDGIEIARIWSGKDIHMEESTC